MAPPLLIGLTGGIAAGKSEALAAFQRLGAETISSDVVVHELLKGDEVRERLVERWGHGVAPDGVVDRGRVAEIVFEDPLERRWLEGLLHPMVGARIAEWRLALAPATDAAVVEVPLLFEAAMEDSFDVTVTVVAGDSLRSERIEARGQGSLEERERAQLAQDEKAARAHHVIRNEGSLEELELALSELLAKLRSPVGDERSDPLQT